MCIKTVHFSVDDTLGCFRWLTENSDKVTTIFDSYVFGLARDIHEKYGVGTSFYCMYTDGYFTIKDVPDRWRMEFWENREWMKFGFHAFGENSRYSGVGEGCIVRDYDAVITELKRIVGDECLTNLIRLHYFAADEETIKYLVGQGVTGFLCADDNRGSYNLSTEEEEIVKSEGGYYSKANHCEFFPTDIRVEHMEDIDEAIDRVSHLHRDRLVMFTHEKFLGKEEIRGMIFAILDGLQGGGRV